MRVFCPKNAVESLVESLEIRLGLLRRRQHVVSSSRSQRSWFDRSLTSQPGLLHDHSISKTLPLVSGKTELCQAKQLDAKGQAASTFRPPSLCC